MDIFKEENIGVDLKLKYGRCLCGKCATGSKPMSLENERKVEDFKSLMYPDEKELRRILGPTGYQSCHGQLRNQFLLTIKLLFLVL